MSSGFMPSAMSKQSSAWSYWQDLCEAVPFVGVDHGDAGVQCDHLVVASDSGAIMAKLSQDHAFVIPGFGVPVVDGQDLFVALESSRIILQIEVAVAQDEPCFQVFRVPVE